ncbi:MAG: mechanosensitive ion channel [Candidatus Eisenbacteria bacterium]|uniref:Mechanosensitive ion channel n=1 Tax=Eiseniibacteriota bacterium TaxID=2212470 RepID=A0A7Y2EAD1_UNCEI|nr:mechanosensitive ion channel [Candidatus Eisenbacteria bacterium]
MDQSTWTKITEEVIPLITQWGIQVLGAIVILIVGRIIAGWAASMVSKALRKSKTDETLIGFLSAMVRYGILAFALIAALKKFGVETTSFVAVLGAAGLAIGLALQGSLANFAAGVMMLIFKPIKVGDLIEAGGNLGVVRKVGLFVTSMDSLENKRIIIPNATLTGDVITNLTTNGTLRVDLVAGIGYGDQIPKAKKILEEICASHPKVLKDPAPQVAVSELGDSSVNFVVRPWCKVEDYWDVYFDVTEAIKLRFDENSVSIPFPQRDVHLFQAQS